MHCNLLILHVLIILIRPMYSSMAGEGLRNDTIEENKLVPMQLEFEEEIADDFSVTTEGIYWQNAKTDNVWMHGNLSSESSIALRPPGNKGFIEINYPSDNVTFAHYHTKRLLTFPRGGTLQLDYWLVAKTRSDVQLKFNIVRGLDHDLTPLYDLTPTYMDPERSSWQSINVTITASGENIRICIQGHRKRSISSGLAISRIVVWHSTNIVVTSTEASSDSNKLLTSTLSPQADTSTASSQLSSELTSAMNSPTDTSSLSAQQSSDSTTNLNSQTSEYSTITSIPTTDTNTFSTQEYSDSSTLSSHASKLPTDTLSSLIETSTASSEPSSKLSTSSSQTSELPTSTILPTNIVVTPTGTSTTGSQISSEHTSGMSPPTEIFTISPHQSSEFTVTSSSQGSALPTSPISTQADTNIPSSQQYTELTYSTITATSDASMTSSHQPSELTSALNSPETSELLISTLRPQTETSTGLSEHSSITEFAPSSTVTSSTPCSPTNTDGSGTSSEESTSFPDPSTTPFDSYKIQKNILTTLGFIIGGAVLFVAGSTFILALLKDNGMRHNAPSNGFSLDSSHLGLGEPLFTRSDLRQQPMRSIPRDR